MIKNFYNAEKAKIKKKNLCKLLIIFSFIAWLLTPPGNKFIQVCFWNNNIQYHVKKAFDKTESSEYLYHRNNAIYLAKMDNKDAALREMDKAIKTMPDYLLEKDVEALYKDRANLRLYYGDYKGSLSDYIRVKDVDILDMFKLGLLYKENGFNKLALTNCNGIIQQDSSAYAGYACMANVYAGIGRFDTAVKVYDILIEKSPNRAQYYYDRGVYKQMFGDESGYQTDMAKVKSLSPNVRIDSTTSLVERTLRPKILDLSII